ncbi:MAG: caspase family protein, partial [Planctomycetes bacterium]|nr:caspase family protein [Planctomycetota bacterium]
MASNQGPSWKNPGAGGQKPANASRRPWQPSNKQVAGGGAIDPRSRFRKRLLAAGGTGAILIGLVILVIWLWKPPKQPALALIAPDTTVSLSGSANVYGTNGAKAFAEWAGQGKDRPRIIGDGVSTSRDAWKAQTAKINEKSVILYFAAHGAADRDGPYLWMTPNDATSVADLQKLPVKEILQRLAELPAEKNKLVIFDATQIAANWAQGFLHNDFARALKTLDAEIEKIPNLVVICASDDDQRSWTSEEWRQTIFGHFVNQGVRGAVGKDHPRITAAVLFDYLKREVGNWARANRDAEQSPILLPTQSGKARSEALEIVSIDPGAYQAPAVSTAPGNSFSVPADLKTAWETADKLSRGTPPPETAAPQVWRTYLDTLMRWEHFARAGAGTEAIQRQAEAHERELRRSLFDADPACLANSLEVAPAFGITLPELDAGRFREIWDPLPGK